jgi:ABC-type branched-subunit amino acid transport system substrate-binding protein/class 3 adenylate cyclase
MRALLGSFFFVVALLAGHYHSEALAAPGEVIFGQSASFSGGAWEPGPRFNAGLLSAFYEVNNNTGGVHGRVIKLHSLDDQYSVPNIAPNVQTLLNIPDMFAFVAFMGSPTTSAALPLLKAAKMPVIGPLTGSAVFRKGADVTGVDWQPYTINVRAGYDDEAFAMLRLFVTEKRWKRISIIYQDDAFGGPAKVAILSAMDNMKLEATSIHSYKRPDIPTYDFSQHAADVWQHNPQGVILYCVEGYSNPFLEEMYKLMAANPTRKVSFITGSWLGDGNRNFIANKNLDPSLFYQTQVVPHPTLSTLNISKQYRHAMTQHADTSFDYLSMEGYIVGRVVIEALQRTPTFVRADFLEAIYNTKLFSIEELLAGPYNQDCVHDSGTATGRSSFCRCNQGMRNVATTTLDSTYKWAPAAADMVYPVTECWATKDIVRRPVVLVSMIPTTASAALTQAVALLGQGISVSEQTAAVAVTESVASSGETTDKLVELGQDTLLLGGLAGMDVAAQDQFPIFPVFTQLPHLATQSYRKTDIHMLATLQQQVYAQSDFVSEKRSGDATHLVLSDAAAAVRNEQGVGIEQMYRDSLISEGLQVGSTTLFNDGNDAALVAALGSVPATASVWVMGISTTGQMDALLDRMEAAPGLNVFISFNDLGLHYAHLSQRYANAGASTATAEVLQRLRFATNLPLWSSPDVDGNVFVKRYQEAMTARGLGSASNISNPIFFTGYFLSRLVDFVLVRTNGDASPESFVKELYHTSVLSMEGVTLGPYIADQCSNEDCLCNVGPRTMEMYSVHTLMYATVNSTADHALRFSKCFVEYSLPTTPEKSYAGIIAAAVVVPVVLIVAIVVGIYQYSRYRKVRYAPKEAAGAADGAGTKFCSMFVSLKNETMLWEQKGEHMPEVMKSYRQLVEDLAEENQCYVAKSIGGAILVVATEPGYILSCASEVAKGLAKELKVFKAMAPDENVNPALKKGEGSEGGSNVQSIRSRGSVRSRKSTRSASSNRSLAVFSNHARGAPAEFAFSIGCNYDRGFITYVSDRHAYDYSGPSVDGAAVISDKTQGHQILVAQGLGPSVATDFDESCFIEFCTTVVTAGKDTLLYQLNPPGLKERTFKVLKHGEGHVDSIASVLEQQSTGVTKRKVTVVSVHFPKLERKCADLSPQAFAPEYESHMKQLNEIVDHEKGHIQWVSGSCVQISFNAAKPCPNQVQRAVTAVEMMKEEMDKDITAGIAAEVSMVGSFTVGGWAHQALMSKAGETSQLLQRLTSRYAGTHCLAHSGIHDELSLCTIEEFVDFFRLPNSVKNRILISVHSLKQEGDADEWMYEMEKQNETNVFNGTNEVYQQLLNWNGPLPSEDHDLFKWAAETKSSDSAVSSKRTGLAAVHKVLELALQETNAPEAVDKTQGKELISSYITSKPPLL